MDRTERGTRNLAKLRAIQNNGGRGAVTFWNPTEADKSRVTVRFTEADVVVKTYEAISEDLRPRLIHMLATMAGFVKLHAFAWDHAEYR